MDEDGATIWRVNDGHDLDRYLFRSASPLEFEIAVAVGETFGPFDADGRPLPESPLYNEPFTLTLRAFDVDEDQGEVDQLSVNGEELVGGTLSGANNQWSINSFSVPGRMLKLYAPEPQLAVNSFSIEIDVNNGGWAVEVDWAELRFDAGPLPVMLNHGITGGKDANDNGCADTSEEPRTIVIDAYAQAHDLATQDVAADQRAICPVASLNATAEYNATRLAEDLDAQLQATGAAKVDIFAHSMGGLNSRVLAHTHTDQVRSIIMFGTPNAGSELADDLCKRRNGFFFSNAQPEMGPCELPDDDGDLSNDSSGGLYQLRTSYMRDVFNDTYPDLASAAYRVYGGYKGGWGSGILNGQDDGTVELSSVYWLRPEGTEVRFLGAQGPEHPGLHEPGDVVDNGHSQLWAADSDALPLATCYRWPTTCQEGQSPATSAAAVQPATDTESPSYETVQSGAIEIPAGGQVTVMIPAQDSVTRQQVMVLPVGDVAAAVDGSALQDAEVFGAPALVGQWVPSPGDAAELTLTNNDNVAVALADYLVWGDTTETLTLEVAQYATSGDIVDITVHSTVGDDVPVTVTASSTAGNTEELVVTPTSGQATGQMTGLTPGVYEITAETDSPYRSTTAFLTVVRGDVTIGADAAFRRFDDNGNGLFDRVTATVDVGVPTATDVRVVGQLATDAGSVVVGGLGRASLTGASTVDVTFGASPLHATGHSGLWHLVRVLVIDDTTGRVLGQRSFAGASPFWSQNSWDRDHVTIGAFTDEAVDTDGDGQLDVLHVDGTLDVLEATTYDINVRLTTQGGRQLGEYQTVRSLDEGVTPLRFTFPGLPIGESGIDGPYVVADLSVYPSSRPSQLTYATVAHVTAPYKACDFVGAECVVTFEAYTEALLNARDAGELTSNGILRSLVAKVDAARSAHEGGDPEATTGALEALENELLGIHERHITDGARRRLLDLLDQLSESL